MNENRGMFGYEGEGFDHVNEDEVRRGHPHEGWNIGREDGTPRPDAGTEPVDDDVPSGTDATPPEAAEGTTGRA